MINNQALIGILIICFTMTFVVGKMNYHNGRLDMCTEMDKYYTVEDECLECVETGRKYVNGECIEYDDEFKLNSEGLTWSNTTI